MKERIWNGISPDTFQKMDFESKLNVMFDLGLENHECSCATKEGLESLKKQVDRRKKIDTTVAAVMGFVAGVLAHVGERILKL